MFQYLPYLVFLGATAQLVGTYFYIKDMARGDVKPNRVTWLLWFVAPLIGTVAALTKGVGLAVLPVFMSGFGPLLVFIASFTNKNSYWKLERFDYWCGLFSLLALILWGITKMPEVAIAFAIASDLLAALPTLLKSWRHPETENAGPFASGLFSSLTSFVAIKMWNFSALAFPIYLVAVNTSILLAIYRRKIFS